MTAENRVRLRVVERSVPDHCLRARNIAGRRILLRWLEQELDVACEALPQAGEHARGPEVAGHVDVMATEVSDARDLRREWPAALVVHREGVHLCPQGHAAIPAPRRLASQDTNDASLADPTADFDPERLQLPSAQLRGGALLKPQLRVRVDSLS
jgi:hypothetical protein